MHRFTTEKPVSGVDERVVFSAEECAHAFRVLRLRPGEEIRLIDGTNLWKALLEEVSGKETVARITALCPSPEAPAQAVLFQGLPKADKLELITQKATELGMWELWPVEMERSIARIDKANKAEKKADRLSRIAAEAGKQSGRAHIPDIRPVQSFQEALKAISKDSFDLILVAWEEEHSTPMSKAVLDRLEKAGNLRRVLIVIGPEGGISEQEWNNLKELGAVSVTLGPRILRTETAGLCALSVLWTALGEM